MVGKDCTLEEYIEHLLDYGTAEHPSPRVHFQEKHGRPPKDEAELKEFWRDHPLNRHRPKWADNPAFRSLWNPENS